MKEANMDLPLAPMLVLGGLVLVGLVGVLVRIGLRWEERKSAEESTESTAEMTTGIILPIGVVVVLIIAVLVAWNTYQLNADLEERIVALEERIAALNNTIHTHRFGEIHSHGYGERHTHGYGELHTHSPGY